MATSAGYKLETKEINKQIVADFSKNRSNYRTPEPGDFIELKDGTLTRYAAQTGKRVQVALPDKGAFFIHKSGDSSFSGALEFGLYAPDALEYIGNKEGKGWIFDGGEIGKGRRVDVIALFNFYSLISE